MESMLLDRFYQDLLMVYNLPHFADNDVISLGFQSCIFCRTKTKLSIVPRFNTPGYLVQILQRGLENTNTKKKKMKKLLSLEI